MGLGAELDLDTSAELLYSWSIEEGDSGQLELEDVGATYSFSRTGSGAELGSGACSAAPKSAPWFAPLSSPLGDPPDPSKMTKFALTFFGTVTTQNAPRPAPVEELPIISFTLFLAGSIAHGRPLQPSPSHSIFTPHFGISFLNGVASSRYIGFQPSLMKLSPLSFTLVPAT